jgi:hypothetical protein
MKACPKPKVIAWKKQAIIRNQLANGKRPIPSTGLSTSGYYLPKPFPLGSEPVVPKRDSHAGHGDKVAAGKNQGGVWVKCGRW